MEIKLTEKQLEIILSIQQEKQHLSSEYQKTSRRETEVITSICESSNVTLNQYSKLDLRQDGVLVITDTTPTIIDESIIEQEEVKPKLKIKGKRK